MRSLESTRIVSSLLAISVGLSCLTGCQTSPIESRTDCVALQPGPIGALALTGTNGVFPKTLLEGYRVGYTDYKNNYTGDLETRTALSDKLRQDGSIELGAADVLAFCITIYDRANPGKGGKFWPYTPPENGPIRTTAVKKTGGEPKFYKDAQKKFPGVKIFVVTPDQTELQPLVT